MPSRHPIPPDYAVVQIDTKWYPLHVERYYTAHAPAGTVHLVPYHSINSAHEFENILYARREDAVRYVQEQAQEDERSGRAVWASLLAKSFSERCVEYLAEIEAITGHSPKIYQWERVTIQTRDYTCCCGRYHVGLHYRAETPEDALREAAEDVYRRRCACTATSAAEYQARVNGAEERPTKEGRN